MSPQPQAVRRNPRVRLPQPTPAVLRSRSGRRRHGDLKVVSLSGGLVCLPKPLHLHARVRLMFTTRAGEVRGSAEMLKPLSSDLQPFRFVAVDRRDQQKLRAAIQWHLLQDSVDDIPSEWYRHRLVRGTFLGDLLGYDLNGDDLQGVNRDPEQNCPICGIAGHKHTAKMSRDCGAQLLSGDDQTGKASDSD